MNALLLCTIPPLDKDASEVSSLVLSDATLGAGTSDRLRSIREVMQHKANGVNHVWRVLDAEPAERRRNKSDSSRDTETGNSHSLGLWEHLKP